MEKPNLSIILKLFWIALTLFTIYYLGWITLTYATLGNIITQEYNFWNLILPNILTFVLLILYAKEVLLGYTPKSINQNLKSLLLLSILIITLIIVQIPQFESLFDNLKSSLWQIKMPYIIILTSYVGIIMNRILKIRELKLLQKIKE